MAKEAKSEWNGFSLKPRKEMPDGLWIGCPGCEQMLYKKAVEDNLNVCPKCEHHFRIEAATRIKYLADEDSFQEFLNDLTTSDPLDFKYRDTTYKQRLKADEKNSGSKEAMRIGKAFIKGRGIILGVMEPNFLSYVQQLIKLLNSRYLWSWSAARAVQGCTKAWSRSARWPRPPQH